MKISKTIYFMVPLLAALFWSAGSPAQEKFDSELLKAFEYRNMAPHRVSAWVGAIAVPETDDPAYRYTWYIAARHGGVWKTENNGVTYRPIFDDYGTNSIGALAVAPSDPEIVWVGTGEASNARSTHAGVGIFKSTDAGESFDFMGLPDSHHIPRIVVHPEDPQTVYVAVMGHLFSGNEQRGVFKTTDGGETWDKVLYINDQVGVIDLSINREDPDVLYAAAYDKRRYPWHYEAGGEHSGIYKTTDAGANWERLEGGFPSGNIGRIGLDVYRKDPDILYAVVENLNPKPGYDANQEVEFDHMRDPYYDRLIGGEVYRSGDAGASWTRMNSDTVDVSGKAAYSFNQIMIDPNNENNLFINSVYMQTSHDKGRTWHDVDGPPEHLFVNMFGDIRSFWINPDDSRHLIVGSDGGVNVTYDGGKNMQNHYHIPLGEIYHVEVDDQKPYHIYAGLQDHEGWRAPSNGYLGRIGISNWNMVGMWDGMYLEMDHQNNRWLYYTTQFGAHHRVDQLKGERTRIEPEAEEEAPPYRYTWDTPIKVSPHNSRILYTGGQMLLRSLDQGDTWQEISPDLTTNDPEKIAGRGHIMYCTITTISESPLEAGVIWVGTDDGRIWLTRNHGADWQELTGKITALGAPAEYWVSNVYTSRHDPGTAYVTKSGFRNDDFTPLVFKTTDYGATWSRVSDGLPDAPVNVIREDPDNPQVLYLGNDQGVYVSITGGRQWTSMNPARYASNRLTGRSMPVVPVKDLVIQPRERDLVIGTYGRGVYITDVHPFREMSPELFDRDVHLFAIDPEPQRNYSQQRHWGNHGMLGDSHIYTRNEPNGLKVYYYLGESLPGSVQIQVRNAKGEEVETLEGPGHKGLHRVIWNTRRADPGTYQVTLQAHGKTLTQPGIVEEPITWTVGNKDKIHDKQNH